MDPRYRTKIVGTLGPATDNPKVLHECLQAGLTIARLNTAHGTEEEKTRRIRSLRKAAQKLDRPVGLLVDLPGLKRQPKTEQSRFKISYYMDPETAPPIDEINSMLHQADLSVNTFLSFGQYLDIVPIRASKGFALRYYADQWGVPLEHVLAAGGSGTDEDMLRGNTLAVVVANRHNEELSHLTDVERIYFSKQGYSRGIIEAIEYYDFFAKCTLPEETQPNSGK